MGGHDNVRPGPASLHKVMRETIGFGLQQRYRPEKEIPHDLLVLIMQMKENDKREQALRDREADGGPSGTEH